jgi:pilus assembly protein CpaD
MSSSDLRSIKERSTMRAFPWIAGLTFLALGACANDGSGVAPPAPLTATERYPIDVRQAPEEVKLAAHATGLSANQANILRDFVASWRQTEAGEITLKAPEHGPDPAGAYRTANDARDFLVAHGVTPSMVRIEGYEANGDDHAPILVSFMRYIAKGPVCGRSWSNLAAVSDNQEYPEFGCAVTANIAAQIGNPADLVSPRASDPADAGRRVTVVETYRKAGITSTPKDPQAEGTLATVGQ